MLFLLLLLLLLLFHDVVLFIEPNVIYLKQEVARGEDNPWVEADNQSSDD